MTGRTGSTNFPVVKAFQPVCGGCPDAFVTKFDSMSGVVFSTYLGGRFGDEGWGIALDAEGNIYVAGVTTSPDFPTAKPFQPSLRGGVDAFVSKFDPTGSALIYSTYLGGSGPDAAFGIAVDPGGQAYLTGATISLDFPTVKPLQAAYGGGMEDAFVTKLDASGAALVYSTYLGGRNEERAHDIAVDSDGNAYAMGVTTSPDFPTVKAFQPVCGGCMDAFVTKLDSSGTAVYSTFLGGRSTEIGRGIAADAEGNAYVTGDTQSPDFHQECLPARVY